MQVIHWTYRRMQKLATGWAPNWITYTHWLKSRKHFRKKRKEKEDAASARKAHNQKVVRDYGLNTRPKKDT